MTIKLLTEQHLEYLSLKEGCTDSSESTLAKMSHCWKSHVMAHIPILTLCILKPLKGYFGKQCRPLSKAAKCYISSGSAQFAKIKELSGDRVT